MRLNKRVARQNVNHRRSFPCGTRRIPAHLLLSNTSVSLLATLCGRAVLRTKETCDSGLTLNSKARLNAQWNGFTASIVVDGVELPDYFDSSAGGDGIVTVADGSKRKPVFIESQTGKQFGIRVKAPGSNAQEYRAIPFIDGHQVTGKVLPNGTVKDIMGVRNKEMTQLRPFEFASVKLVTDDGTEFAEELLEAQKAKGVEGGTIRVEFWRWRSNRLSEPVQGSGNSVQAEQVAIHEKAKKGAFLSHTTAFGAQIPAVANNINHGRNLGNAPFFVAVFEYRSRIPRETIDGLNLPPSPSLSAPQRFRRMPTSRFLMILLWTLLLVVLLRLRRPRPARHRPRLRAIFDNVLDLLTNLGLERFENVFEQNELDLDALVLATDDDLRSLNLPMGPMLKLRDGVKRLKELMGLREPTPPVKTEPAVKREREENGASDEAAKRYKGTVENGVLTVDLTEDD